MKTKLTCLRIVNRLLVSNFICAVWVLWGTHWVAEYAFAQQQANADFQPQELPAAFEKGAGPRVRIDEAHQNFHTRLGRYQPFSLVLEADGFQVASQLEKFSAASLVDLEILVIANPLHESNQNKWEVPTPSAFSAAEIEAVVDWVEQGGSLLLIADHMPFPGATAELAARFDIEMSNGFAFQTNEELPLGIERAPILFRKEPENGEGSIKEHPITMGLREGEAVEQVATFTGQAFRAGQGAEVLLELPANTVSLEPNRAWDFTPDTKRQDVGKWAQALAMTKGKGRIAVFGEAAMFSSQWNPRRGTRNGMSLAIARDNQLLLRNVIRWLGGFEASE